MATTSTTYEFYQKINKLIKSSRFNEAFLLLKKYLKKHPSLVQLKDKAQTLETNYRYMLDYIAEGNYDPSQEEVLDQIKDSLYLINDAILREEKLIDSPDLYSSTRRMIAHTNATLKERMENFIEAFSTDNPQWPDVTSFKISNLQNKALEDLFNYIWTWSNYDTTEMEELNQVLDDAQMPEYLKLLIISALLLGGISYFRADTFEILLNQYEIGDSPAIKARALTGLLLLSLLHPHRIAGNIALKSRLLLTNLEENDRKLLAQGLMDIIRTYDTKRVDNKMRNEVLPGLMKMSPNIINKMRNLSSDSDNFLGDDENPEWEEFLENSEIGDKLREINEMQLDGADVMVTAFSNLKSFPFFNSVSNWFLPFVPGNQEFENLPLDRDEETSERLTAVMCDSDLHSFLLSMKSMPEENRNQMMSNISSQMKQAKEAMESAIGETQETIIARKMRQNLQDLYRFFKFYRKKDDFTDPFDKAFTATEMEPLMPIFGIEKSTIRLIGEFYLKNKYYEEAAAIFELLDRLEPGDFTLWEKIGYCYDRIQQPEEALKWFEKADILNPGNTWLEKRIALTLKNLGRFEEALKFYEKALEKEPENYHLIMSAAQCLLETQNYEKALSHYYHAQYLKPTKNDSKRGAAWTEMMAGNFEKSMSIYEKIMQSEDSNDSDYLNAGHCALAGKDIKNALKLYKIYVGDGESSDITKLVIAFRDDNATLKQLGIKTQDLRFIVDKIRYDLSS